MRIVFVSTLKGTPWGGSEELWAAACERALHNGHAAMICRYQWPESLRRQESLRQAGAKLSLRPRRAGKIARLFPRPGWLREIDGFAPDVVCISQGNAYECAGHRSMVPLLKWLARTNVALVNLIQFNSEDTGLGRAAANRARWLYQRATTNAFVAMDNHRLAESRLRVRIERAVEVRNPVNLSDTCPVPWPCEDVVRMACVARLDARTKGQDVLLEVLAKPQWTSRPWTLSLFGVGPDEQRFADQSRRLGLSDRVSFLGHSSDIRAIWRNHQVLLLPSRAEGTPLAMVEAMVLGRPCMVCAVGGCADWVRDGENGFLSPEPNTDSVGSAMERLWSARERWPSIGAAARESSLAMMGPDPGLALLDVLVAAARSHSGAVP